MVGELGRYETWMGIDSHKWSKHNLSPWKNREKTFRYPIIELEEYMIMMGNEHAAFMT